MRKLSALMYLLCAFLLLANVRGTSLVEVVIPTDGASDGETVVVPTDGEIDIYPSENSTGMFGNMEIGDEFVHVLTGDIWGSIFECPENGYAKSITAYLKCDKTSRVRCVLYQEFDSGYVGLKYFRFVMATEEKIIPAGFEGRVKFNFTAPPPITAGLKYWIAGWADEYGLVCISTKKTPAGEYPSAEWTSYMMGEPHGLSYPRFYEIVPQGIRIGCICSIYCDYDFEVPTSFICPYCGAEYTSFEEVSDHIATTPLEQIHLHICFMEGGKCNHVTYLDCEMKKHQFEKHGIGSMPTECECIFCDFTAPLSPEDSKWGIGTDIYKHINDINPGPGPAEGGDEVSYLTVPVKVVSDGTMEYRLVGPSDTEPTPADGYTIDPEAVEVQGVQGKFWLEYKIST